MASSDSDQPAPRPGPSLLLWGWIIFSLWGIGPFVAAGTVHWLWCWLYFGLLVAGFALQRFYLATRSPQLVQVRRRIGAGTPTWDLVWNLVFWLLMTSVPIVAGLGLRLGWPALPKNAWVAGVLVLAVSMSLSTWAMVTNPHFEGTVRIQRDRDHRVIDGGPYRWVRHPGYTGLCLLAVATPLLLISLPASIPAGIIVVWVIVRTLLEDRLLRRELEGYSAYAARVHARLVPGLW